MCQIHTLMVLGLSSVAFSSVDRVGYPQLRFKTIVTRYLLFKDNMDFFRQVRVARTEILGYNTVTTT